MWVKMCLALPAGSMDFAESPICANASETPASSRFPKTLGNSQSEARSPVSARFRSAALPFWKSSSTVRSSILRAFFFARTGKISVRPFLYASHIIRAGQISHFGAPFGRHTVAPRSIIA